MQIKFVPQTEYQHFAQRVYNLLVENSAQTFFVGGAVRNLLLNFPINDFDIATDLVPDQVIKILSDASIQADDSNKNFGVIKATNNDGIIEITTFRVDKYSDSRYPDITLVNTAKEDSERRDFTINSLYFHAKTAEVLDFHDGLDDLGKRQVRFIGEASVRIKEDPIRIIRAFKLADELKFVIDAKTESECVRMISLLKNISTNKLKSELNKCSEKVKNKINELLSKNS